MHIGHDQLSDILRSMIRFGDNIPLDIQEWSDKQKDYFVAIYLTKCAPTARDEIFLEIEHGKTSADAAYLYIEPCVRDPIMDILGEIVRVNHEIMAAEAAASYAG